MDDLGRRKDEMVIKIILSYILFTMIVTVIIVWLLETYVGVDRFNAILMAVMVHLAFWVYYMRRERKGFMEGKI